MKTTNWQKINPIENPHGIDGRKIYDTQHAEIIHLTLKPGEKLIKHITPVDVVFYVLEGKGIVEIGKEKKEVKVETLVESPAKIPHCWYNTGPTPLRILVIKVPKPTKPTIIL